MATRKGFVSTVDLLVLQGGKSVLETVDKKNKQNVLHLAISNNRINVLELLLKYQSNLIDALDGNGKTPMHIAAETGNAKAGNI